METKTFVFDPGDVGLVAPSATTLITIENTAWCSVITSKEKILPSKKQTDKHATREKKNKEVAITKWSTHPVETILFSRTRMAPTRRFMQLERCEAREARV